jgi:hypothetical protein
VRQKLDSKSYECVLMGFGEYVKGYGVYNTKTHKTFFIHGFIFYEYLVLVEFLVLTQWTIGHGL